MSDYLIHYGVKGMKWGVRKERPYSGSRRAFRQANREYSKSYNKAYNYSATHPVRQFVKGSKWQKESNRRWEDAYDKAAARNKAKAKYKQEKKAYKKEHPMSNGKKAAIAAGVGIAVAGTVLAVYGKKKYGSLNPKKMKAAKEIANRISGRSNEKALKSIQKTYSANKRGTFYKMGEYNKNPFSNKSRRLDERLNIYDRAKSDNFVRAENNNLAFKRYYDSGGRYGREFVRRNYRG